MIDVRTYGAVGDGRTLDTAAIQKALDTGEMVCFPAGTYYTGTLYLRSGGGIHLEEGASLLASIDPADYNKNDDIPINYIPKSEHVSGAHLLMAIEQQNITISGKGTIDGNSDKIFDLNTVETWCRPHYPYPEWRIGQMVFLYGCQNVTIRDVNMNNAQFWTCFLWNCDHANISGVKIRADRLVLNSDGLDIDCCRHVVIEDCDIDCGDDSIAVRASNRLIGKDVCCEDIQVRRCILGSPACAVRIGVGQGYIRNCHFSDIEMVNSDDGVGFCPSYSAGNCTGIEHITFENVHFKGNQPFRLTPTWLGGIQNEDDPMIKPVKDLVFRNFHAEARETCIFVAPAGENIFEGIVFDNVTIDLQEPGTRPPENFWPGEEYGVLNFYRYKNVDTSGLKVHSANNLPGAVFKP
ncbi:MAG: hypothetical protein J6W81_03960 [Lentisphaeria bacterium]|nr:hypothetical protein [Lentisphaeria bacterium]